MSNFTPKHLRRGNGTKNGSPDNAKKQRYRKYMLDNKKWCNADFALVERENFQYVRWCNSIDASLGIKRTQA